MTDFFKQFEAYLTGKDSSIVDIVNDTDKGDATSRMTIYRYSYAYQLIDILADDFPTIYQILGTEAFAELAETYLMQYPSTSYTVRHFGQHFAKFLNETQPYASYSYLTQIADFEWAKGLVFDASDSETVTLEKLATIPESAWDSVTFRLIPALKRLIYDYNVPQIWQVVENGSDNDGMPEPTRLDKPLSWVMWRKDFNPNWYSLTQGEDQFLFNARQGKRFGELCQILYQTLGDEEQTAIQAAGYIRHWIDEKMLADIVYD